MTGCKPTEQVRSDTIVREHPWVLTRADSLRCVTDTGPPPVQIIETLGVSLDLVEAAPDPPFELKYVVRDTPCTIWVSIGEPARSPGFDWDGQSYVLPTQLRSGRVGLSGLNSPGLARMALAFGDREFENVDWSDPDQRESAHRLVELKSQLPELEHGADSTARDDLLIVLWNRPIDWDLGGNAVHVEVWDGRSGRRVSFYVAAASGDAASAWASRLACGIRRTD